MRPIHNDFANALRPSKFRAFVPRRTYVGLLGTQHRLLSFLENYELLNWIGAQTTLAAMW